jgi:DNA-directed RNA polymerase subunit RPC12/RpoP
VCPECKNLSSKITYYNENFKGSDYQSNKKLVSYTEITFLKCSNCGWETEIYGDRYGFLIDGTNVNRPGTKEHKIYKAIYCQDCGKEIFQGDWTWGTSRCPYCQTKYARENYNYDTDY